jgi:hypothetical protein
MVAHSVRNAKVFFSQGVRRKKLPTPHTTGTPGASFFCLSDDLRGKNHVLLPFLRSPLFSPGRPYYVIPASLTVDSEKTMSGRQFAALLLGVGVLAAASPACADPFRFPWDPPAPVRQQTRPAPVQERPVQEQQYPQAQQPLGPARLSPRQVRAILAREGAQMIGKPRAIRDELIVLGRDSNGEGHKYILDAISGDVLAVEDALLPERRRDEQTPVHAPDGRIESGPLGAPPESPPIASAPPAAAKLAPPQPPAMAPAPNPSDSALSPIKPLRPPGAPRVEPLPQ